MQLKFHTVVQSRHGNNLLNLKQLQSTLGIFTGEELPFAHISMLHSCYIYIVTSNCHSVAFHGAWSFIHSSRGQAYRAEGILKTVLASLQEKCDENSAEFAHALQGLGLAYDKLRLYDKSL